MKNIISIGRKIMIAALLVFALTVCAAAQALSLKIGDTVQTPDGRIGKIETINEQGMAKLRFSKGAIATQYFMLTDLKAAEAPKPKPVAAPETSAQKTERAAFEKEAQPFMVLIRSLAHAYNPKFRPDSNNGFSDEPATYEKWRKDLEALSVVCGKYPNLTSRPNADESNINHNLADWCKIADQRTAVINKMKTMVGELYAKTEADRWKLKIDQLIRNWNGYVKDDLQMLLYDRAAWEQKNLESIRKKYTDVGETMPPDLFASLDEKVNELKAKIEEDAATRSWTQPPYSDAALEAAVKKAYPTSFPGVKVFKTGMTFTTWKAEDDTSLVGSGTDYKLYRTTKGAYRYKLGLALVKLPNQPLCQIRDFEFHQDKSGAGYSTAKLYLPLGYTGIFVKCP